jgi:hypothetical protein
VVGTQHNAPAGARELERIVQEIHSSYRRPDNSRITRIKSTSPTPPLGP